MLLKISELFENISDCFEIISGLFWKHFRVFQKIFAKKFSTNVVKHFGMFTQEKF